MSLFTCALRWLMLPTGSTPYLLLRLALPSEIFNPVSLTDLPLKSLKILRSRLPFVMGFHSPRWAELEDGNATAIRSQCIRTWWISVTQLASNVSASH